MNTKTCKTCSVEQPIENYYKGKGGYPNNECKTCSKKRVMDRGPEYHFSVWLKTRYGLTPETYHKMVTDQNGACAICKRSLEGRRFVVDHNHACCNNGWKTCGKCVRALLCYGCNSALGQFRDDPVVLKSAIDYIVNHQIREGEHQP